MLLTKGIWTQITKAAKLNRGKSHVAVAYFGANGSKMLPLTKGSKIVVDASEATVKSGQTSPKELIKLYNRGVNIYTYPFLHAKTYLLGRKLFLGSTNVSSNSSLNLKEAVIVTTDSRHLMSARSFIDDLCVQELGIERLRRLSRLYRPPKFGQRNGTRKKTTDRAVEKNHLIRLVNLVYKDEPEGLEESRVTGEREAKRKRIKTKRHRVDSFFWSGSAPFQRGEHIIQVIADGRTKFVEPPGTVIHKKPGYSSRGTKYTHVYVEVPNRRSKKLTAMEKSFNRMERKSLERAGYKNTTLTEKLLSIWKV